jgi:hypothetical protein
MFKKIASLILCAVMILGAVSACNVGDDEQLTIDNGQSTITEPENEPEIITEEPEIVEDEPEPPFPITLVSAPPEERPLTAWGHGVVVRENPNGVEEYVKISQYRDLGFTVTIVSVWIFADSEWFTYDDFVFGFGGTTHDIYYGTTIPVKEDYKFPEGSNMPDKEFYEAIIFSDSSGNYTRSFVLGRDENGEFEAIEAKISNLPRFPYIKSWKYLYDLPGTIPIKLFSYSEVNSTMTGDTENLRYVTVYIPEENFLEEAAKLMYLQELFSVNRLWYEGNRLYADMNVTQLRWASNGSMGAAVFRSTLLATLESFPDVEEIVILFEGIENVYIDGFPYNGIFVVNSPDNGFIQNEEWVWL